MFKKEYWDNRVEKYGHTGHAEPFLYCFDQQARLYAIDTILKNILIQKKFALDFGCGSGDFIEPLSRHFKNISGFDISEKVVRLAQERFKNSSVNLSNHFPNTSAEDKFDCILTVTVLQSFSHEELEKTIQKLTQILNDEGKLICMEFFASEEYNQKANENRITDSDWFKILKKNNLCIESSEGFYNPVLYPTVSWHEYSKSLFTNILKLFKNQTFVQKLLIKRAKKIINQRKDVYPFMSSSFKIYIIKKR